MISKKQKEILDTLTDQFNRLNEIKAGTVTLIAGFSSLQWEIDEERRTEAEHRAIMEALKQTRDLMFDVDLARVQEQFVPLGFRVEEQHGKSIYITAALGAGAINIKYKVLETEKIELKAVSGGSDATGTTLEECLNRPNILAGFKHMYKAILDHQK